jgi:hypothetical protein
MTLNIFKAIGDFCTNFLFKPYQGLTNLDDKEHWWTSNFFNAILFIITAYLFVYWLIKLRTYKKQGTE